MKIVFLDAYTMNPGDLDFFPLEEMGSFTSYDRTDFSEISKRARDADVIIVNKFPVNTSTLNLMPQLQYICVAATGFNNIDLPAVKEKNIWVSNVRDYSSDSVAQHVFASILAFYNKIEHYDALVKSGVWSRQKDFCFYEKPILSLNQLTIGIVGYGSIGKKMAILANVFGMKVIVYSRSKISQQENVKQVDKKTLLNQADIITLHIPLTEETRHWIDKTSLQEMKKTAVLINTARGPLVNADDLLVALEKGKIGGAVLDVLDEEPPKNPHKVIFHPNCIVTPHIAWAGLESRQKLLAGICQNINAFLKGEWINPIY